MKNRFLITTADERSWRTDKPILCLGEWCRLYERRQFWTQLDAEVVPYHWDDRQQLYKDYCYLRNLHEELLVEISTALNQFHNVDHSIRYWRILVGPWLGYFTQMLFDRWVMIQRAVATCPIEGTVILDLPLDDVIPNEMADFDRLYISDKWNHYIYGRIIQEWTEIPCEYLSVDPEDNKIPITATAQQLSLKRQLKQLVKRVLSRISISLTRPTDAFMIASYLPRKESLKLQMALGQCPAFWDSPSPSILKPVVSVRKTFQLLTNAVQGFEQCVRTLIPEQIPSIYLEGYTQLQDQITQLSWPQNPKFIFTSTSYSSDDVFKAWAAEKVDIGCPIVIGQHGGLYGNGLWSFCEEHELAISDLFLTWGWTEDSSKHLSIGLLKLLGEGEGIWDPDGELLLVTCTLPRYSYWMASIVVAGQYFEYLKEQFSFVDVLPPRIRQQLLVRLYSHPWYSSEVQQWRDRHPDVQLNLKQKPIKTLIQQSRLYVATYNGTTFLETLGQNIPTIMFWNPNYWELRSSAQPYFEELKRVGIFHETPASAAAKVAEVWDDVPGWWNSSEVQAARRTFCDRFARMPENPTQVLKKALTELVESKKAN
ncbi:LIC12162 family transferase [Phormidium sp. CCY1219]|uniref:LIC12162 family transferase n=1 Tax=Phormidium sp. CCY1219 TaxID=2886104 RepID=UPI002D1F87A1|nr:LIC12162 family protein [Phormidium sp. CCY1219]MEB3828468.1 LIC12162 family protein [Phormidium sp. CCY1219]